MLPASSGEESSIKDCQQATLCIYHLSTKFITYIINVTENKTNRINIKWWTMPWSSTKCRGDILYNIHLTCFKMMKVFCNVYSLCKMQQERPLTNVFLSFFLILEPKKYRVNISNNYHQTAGSLCMEVTAITLTHYKIIQQLFMRNSNTVNVHRAVSESRQTIISCPVQPSRGKH